MTRLLASLSLLCALPAHALTVVLLSANGSQTCPAQGLSYDAGKLTVAGIDCAPDQIFKSGFGS